MRFCALPSAGWRRSQHWLALLCLGCVDGHSASISDARIDGPVANTADTNAPETRVAFATEVYRAPGHTGDGFGDANRSVNGVRGAGAGGGSLDVYSLDYTTRTELVLALPCAVVDAPGADIVVFENAFTVRESDGVVASAFMDQTVVSVSADGNAFVELPHAYRANPETRYSAVPADWVGFAGVRPVLLHAENNPVDPFSSAAGGDAFDLAAFDGAALRSVIQAGIRYVRMVPAAIVINPNTGMVFPRDPVSNGPDIDGVAVRCAE